MDRRERDDQEEIDGERDPTSRSARPAYIRLITVLAWVLPGVAILTLALLQLRSRGATVGTLSIASYEAQAQVEASPAPDFQLPDIDSGTQRSLAALHGRVVVLNFWASWCPPCRQEAPDLQGTWASYRHRGVRFLGIDERDNDAAARAFEREFGITYPSVADPAGRLAQDYRLFGLPTTVVVDPSGQMVYRFTGFLTGRVLQATLNDVLSRGGA
ncbi:MAG: TlpA family protein disulfide reductase [Actinomycetota bacterium]|nr:TlpA family protein disulfide reductase [Actinomycetota bacterium]